jgi:TolA-binding protein
VDFFPESSNKYKALFLTGFVYSEQLQDYDMAKEAYQKVVENYPDCDLADDAKFMLENLGSDSLPKEVK